MWLVVALAAIFALRNCETPLSVSDLLPKMGKIFTDEQLLELDRQRIEEEADRAAFYKANPNKIFDWTADTRNYIATVPGIRRMYGSAALLEDGQLLRWKQLMSRRMDARHAPNQTSTGPKVIALAGSPGQDVLWSDGTLNSGHSNNRSDTVRIDEASGQYIYNSSEKAEGQTALITDGVDLVAGGNFRLVLRADGSVWGYGGNEYGQLGHAARNENGQMLPPTTPVMDLKNIVAIAAGFRHAIALKNDGTVWQWGHNSNQLFTTTHGKTPGARVDDFFHPRPTQVKGLVNIIKIASGDYHNLALDTNGAVWAWGRTGGGRLGVKKSFSNDVIGQRGEFKIIRADYVDDPVVVTDINNVIDIAAAAGHSLALKKDGSVWGWGINQNHQIGHREARSSYPPIDNDPGAVSRNEGPAEWPFQLRAVDRVKKIFTSREMSVLIKHDDAVWFIGVGAWQHFPFAVRVPGEQGRNTKITFQLAVPNLPGSLEHEFGFYRVDDTLGRIGQLRPGDPGYAAAALAPDRITAIFEPGRSYGHMAEFPSYPETRIRLAADQLFAAYLIQKASVATWKAKNSANQLIGSPLAFFSYPAANPDGFDHVQFGQLFYGSWTFKWEDRTGGKDSNVRRLISYEFGLTGEGLVHVPVKVVQREALTAK